jgi:hypothetical protein
MHDSQAVGVGEGGDDLAEEAHGAGALEGVVGDLVAVLPRSLDDLLERWPVEMFHRDVVDTVAGAAADVDGGEVAVGQPRGGAGLLVEALDDATVVGQVGSENFERNFAIHADLQRAVDGAHAAFSESRDDGEVFDSSADQWIALGAEQIRGVNVDGAVVGAELFAGGLAWALADWANACLKLRRADRLLRLR